MAVYILDISRLSAQTIVEDEATPSVMENIPGKLLITEVNFKNSDGDWVEFLYLSPSNLSINLKGISFQDDKIFKTVENDFYLKPNQYGTLFFKKNDPDKAPVLSTPYQGLTATTEQIIVIDKDNTIIDAVCWTSDKPTASEIKDMEKLFEKKGWKSPDINSCVPSGSVKSGNSIIRQNSLDSGTSNDWVTTDHPTPGSQNIANAPEVTAATHQTNETTTPAEEQVITTHPSQIETIAPEEAWVEETSSEEWNEVPISLATSAPPEISSVNKKTSTSTKATSTKKSKEPDFRNGNLSTEIIISEIMPNPEKDDNKNEWIELTNKGNKEINMGNWQLDDIEGGSKPYILSDEISIEAGKTLLVSISESKISLGNKEDSVRLINFEGEAVDEISYEEAPKEQSYARIVVQKENGDEEEQWQWTAESTPDQPNPVYQELTGIIVEDPDFENYSFTFQLTDQAVKTVFFSESVIPGPLAKTTFIKGTELKAVLVEKDGGYELKSYEIINAPALPSETSILLPMLVSTGVIMGGVGFWWYKKKYLPSKRHAEALP